MSRNSEKWPDRQVAQLEELVRTPGMFTEKIAHILRKPTQAVRTKMVRMGLTIAHPPKWTDERLALLKELWSHGLTASQIASRLGGVTRNSVIGKIHRLGLSGRRPKKASRASVAKPRQKKPATRRTGFMKPSPLIALLQSPLPPEDSQDIATTTVLDREPHQCSWVIGPPSEGKMCGAPIVPELSAAWCEKHAIRGYQPPQPRRQGHFVLRDKADLMREREPA